MKQAQTIFLISHIVYVYYAYGYTKNEYVVYGNEIESMILLMNICHNICLNIYIVDSFQNKR